MSSSPEHARLLRLATRASVAVASILIVTKAIAWWLSGSVSMLAGLTDSALDGVTSFLNLLAVHYALRPADDDHRYGHGKAESLSGMAQALFIAGSAGAGGRPDPSAGAGRRALVEYRRDRAVAGAHRRVAGAATSGHP